MPSEGTHQPTLRKLQALDVTTLRIKHWAGRVAGGAVEGQGGSFLEWAILCVILRYLGIMVVGTLSDPSVELGPCVQGS